MSRGGLAGEQIAKNGPRSATWRRFLKRWARRQDRRCARRMGEDAPKVRHYAGWGD